MKTAIVTSGFLPVPATKGGAVENIVVNVLNVNEKEKKEQFLVYSIYDKKAAEESKKYKETQFVFIKSNVFIKSLDRITFFVAKNFLRKKNSQSYRYIFQRLYFLRKVSNDLHKNNYKKIILENHPTQYLTLKWKKNYIKYKDKFYYHCHNEIKNTYGCDSIIMDTKKIICVSEYMKRIIIDKFGIDSSKVVVLKNIVDNKIFKKEVTDEEKEKIKSDLEIKENEKIILFSGRIVPEKGIKELLNALKNINYKNYKLIIIGSPLSGIKSNNCFEKEIINLANQLEKKVVFTGYVPYEETYKYYKISDFAVLPSIWEEPAGLTILESMICNLPVITTYSGGIPEYTDKRFSILLNIDEKLTINLSNAIENLLNNDTELEKLKNNIINFYNKKDIKEYYKNFIKIMEK